MTVSKSTEGLIVEVDEREIIENSRLAKDLRGQIVKLRREAKELRDALLAYDCTASGIKETPILTCERKPLRPRQRNGAYRRR